MRKGSFTPGRAGWALAAGALVPGPALATPAERPLRVAAAADLALAFKEVGDAFTHETGERVVFSFGSTGLLVSQIEQGAPFDVFAAANLSFADEVIRAGACSADSKALYARGRIVLWTPKGTTPPSSVAALTEPRWVRIAIANPAHAPYGRAALEALVHAGIDRVVRPRLVYGENVQQALAFAQSGNAEVALVALSLALATDGAYLPIDEAAHQPLDQAMVVCAREPARQAIARRFTAFVNAPAGRAIMSRHGFLLPGEARAAAKNR